MIGLKISRFCAEKNMQQFETKKTVLNRKSVILNKSGLTPHLEDVNKIVLIDVH